MSWFKDLLLSWTELKMPPLGERDKYLAQQFRDALAIDEDKAAASGASNTWDEFSAELRQYVDDEDPREFLQWPVVRKSMFVSNPRYVAEELRFLKSRPDWNSRWKSGLLESPIGRPRPYPRYPKSSGNLIHHAYSVARFEEFAGIRVDALGLVYEFGGGYGSMTRLFRQLGFAGKYLIQDLPGFSALQNFYLGSLGYMGPDESTLACVSDFEGLGQKLEEWRDDKPKLFLATWSLSESPLVVRSQVLDALSDFDYLLVAFQHSFEDIDNPQYFRTWQDRFAGQLDITIKEIEHLPGNSYLFASRKQS